VNILRENNQFQGFLWDVEGVLVDTEEIHFRSWQWLLEQTGSTPLTIEEYASCVGSPSTVNMERVARLRNLSGNLDNLRRLRRDKFEELCLEEIPVIEKNVELVKQFNRMFPSAQFATVSNAPRAFIEKYLKITRLQEILQLKVSFDDIQGLNKKPAPDLYLYTLGLMNISQDSCIGFEDSQSGIVALKTAGITAIALPNRLTASLDFSLADMVLKPGEKRDAGEIIKSLTK